MEVKSLPVKLILVLNLLFLLSACNSVDDGAENPKPLADPPPSNVIVSAHENAVEISWDVVDSAVSYSIYMASEAGVNINGVGDDGVTPLQDFMSHTDVPNPFTHVNLENDKAYYFRVTSIGDNGAESSLSVEVSATPYLFPAPVNFTATVSDSEISLDWDAVNNATSYNIYMANEAGVNQQGLGGDGVTPLANFMRHEDVAKPFLHVNLVNDNPYYFRVSAVNSSGDETELSQEILAIPQALLAPQNVSVLPSDMAAQLQWDAVATAVSYNIYMAQEPGVNIAGLAADDVTPLNGFMKHENVPSPFTHSNLINDTRYYFVVSAINGLGLESVISSEVDVIPALILAAPTALSADSVSATQVSMSWVDNSNDELGFKIERAEVSAGSVVGVWTARGDVGPNSNSFQDIPVTPASRYRYRVYAYNSNGNSAFSNSIEVDIPQVPPAAPSLLLANNITPTQVDFSWTDNSTNEAGFKLERADILADGSASVWAEVAQSLADVTTLSDSSVVSLYNYRYRVSAFNIAGSAVSNLIDVSVPPPLPGAPSLLQVGVVTSTAVPMSWQDNSSNEDGFRIQRVTLVGGAISGSWAQVGEVGPNIVDFADSTVTQATSYRYRVSAYNVTGGSPFSNNLDVDVPDVPPAAPSLLLANNITPTQVDFSWTDNSTNETGFKLERADILADGSAGVWAEVAQSQADVTTLSDSSVISLYNYRYRVSAFNTAGPSAISNLIDVSVPPPLPGAPSLLQVGAVTTTTVAMSWQDNSSDEDGFRIQRVTLIGGAVSGSWAQVGEVAANVIDFTDNSVTLATSYRYRVSAYNVTGGSPFSNNLDVDVPDVPPAAPSLLLANNITPTQVDFSWTDNSTNETGFRLERADILADGSAGVWAEVAQSLANVTTLSDSSVVSLYNYRYRVTAFNTAGSAISNLIDVSIPPPLPAAPSTLQIGVAGSISVPLSWQDNSNNEDGFVIERAELLAAGVIGTWSLALQVGANSVAAIDASMPAGKSYSYRVKAFNVTGESLPSLAVDVQVPPKDANKFLSFANSTAPRFVETAETALAYYAAIDPFNRKTTLTDWRRENGFGLGGEADVPAIYLNDADLGFGRRMYVNNRATGGIGSYVENYATLDAAIAGTSPLLTVAMEYTQPEVNDLAERTKEVVLAQNSWTVGTNTFSRVLQPGTYEVVPGRAVGERTSTGPFNLTINSADGSVAQNINGEWVSPWYGFNNATDYVDASNPRYSFTLVTAQSVTINLSSPAAETEIWVLGSIGKILAEDDNSGGGVNASITYTDLPVGDYTVIPTAAQPFNNFSLVNIVVSGSGAAPVAVSRTAGMLAMGVNDPNSPVYRDLVKFSISVPQTVTISAIPVAGDVVDPYLYLVGAGATGVDVIRSLYKSTAPSDIYSNSVTLDLPSGTYTAVAGSREIGAVKDFTMNIVDDLGAPIPLNAPPVQKWTNSGGATPYSANNPRFSFTVNPPTGQTQRVKIDLSTDFSLLPIIRPQLYVLGAIGDYRNIEAVNTGIDLGGEQPLISEVNTVLAAGNYSVVAATVRPAINGDFNVEVVDGNGTSLLSSPGTWINSAGYHYYAASNPRFNFTVPANNTAVTVRLTPVDQVHTMAYVLDSVGTPIVQNGSYQIYYDYSVDAQLLAGQYMLVATTDDNTGTASDFSIELSVDGVVQSTFTGSWLHSEKNNPYSPNNPRFPFELNANSRVVAKLTANTRASLYVLGLGDEKITTFYTFAADGTRVTSADLDGRGAKYQPGVCSPCHGGQPKALVGGVYPDYGDTGAGFIAWDLDLYKYSTSNPLYSRANMEAKFKSFNKSVLAVHRMPATGAGEDKEPVRNTLIKGWYGGADLPNSVFDGNFVPKLWLPDSITGNIFVGIPDGADQLYLNVVKPTCRVCHVQRGGLQDASADLPDMALAFGSYEAFISYQQEIEDTIYDQGTMPLALRTYNKFWQTGQGDILTQHMPGFNRFEADGVTPLKPGRPIADAGTSLLNGNRQVAPGSVVTLNGSQSKFASSYNWNIRAEPAGSTTLLSSVTAVKPSFTANAAGDYVIDLTVSDGVSNSTASITITALAGYVPVSFAAQIKPQFDTATSRYLEGPLKHCMRCHIAREDDISSNFGVYFDGYSHHDSPYSAVFSGADVYSVIRDRVNLDAPKHSLMLEKPASDVQHGGGIETGYRPADTQQYYDLILRWILEGAQNN